MDYMENENVYGKPQQKQQEQSPNGMATASLVMGILALVTCCCWYGGLIFGGLGILFALLSRGSGKMEGSATAGLILSITAIALVILVWGFLLLAAVSSESSDSPGTFENLPNMPVEEMLPAWDNVVSVLGRIPGGNGL